MSKELLFWLYASQWCQYRNEMSGTEKEDCYPILKKEAESLGIEWNEKYIWKTPKWLKEHIK